MKAANHIIASLALALLSFGANNSSAQSVQRLNATKANDYGLIYSLPNTALDVTIEAEITSKQPGEFAKYAAKYLNDNNPILKPSTSVKVKSVVINTSGVANPDKRYLITLKGGQAPYILLSDSNLPLAINSESIMEPQLTPIPTAVPPQPTALETEAARQAITQEMLQSHSSAKRAELTAEQIYALRQSRTEIITGQADQMPPDGAAMQLVLDGINAQEQALVAMFVGTTSTYTDVRTFRIVPDSDLVNFIIARISSTDGIVEPTDLRGTPVYLSLKVIEDGKLPVNEKGEKIDFPKGGVAYCIPGKAEVDIRFDGASICRKTVEMAQFGVVYGMSPDNFSDKKAPLYLLFDPATGAAAEVGPAKL